MITIMTAAERAEAQRQARQRAIKGDDVRSHYGARPRVHRSARDKARNDRRGWRRDLD